MSSDSDSDFYSLIVPTYNEVDNLPLVVYLINKYLEDYHYEVIIVDDNSQDGTQDVARRLIDIFGSDKIVLKTRAGKLGLGTAYKHGFGFARGNFVLIMDADLSHHPKFIPQMIEKQKSADYDFITGTRYRGRGGVFGWNLFRKLTSKCANTLAQVMLNPGVSDLTGSFRLYKREVFDRIIHEDLPQGYAFQMAIAVRAKALGFRCGEVPISFVDRLYGTSKLSAREVTGFAKGVWQLFWSV